MVFQTDALGIFQEDHRCLYRVQHQDELTGDKLSVAKRLPDSSECQQQFNRPTCRLSQARVEAGSNTFTIALRLVGDDEKGTQCLGV
jgi:hypothetical protein